jgi:hypothetical protein
VNDVIEILVADNRNDPILISYDFNLPCALEHYIAGG